MRHYSPIIAKTQAIINGLFVSDERGPHTQDAFLWDASKLFQEAVRGALSAWSGGVLVKARPSAHLLDNQGLIVKRSPVDPDYVLDVGATRLLLDAKYKEVDKPSAQGDVEFALGGRKVRIGRTDVYQAVSYGRHDQWRPAVVGLIYPVTLDAGDTIPPPYRVRGFGDDIAILFFDIGFSASSNLGGFYRQLDDLVANP